MFFFCLKILIALKNPKSLLNYQYVLNSVKIIMKLLKYYKI